jgi:hypothetical protein
MMRSLTADQPAADRGGGRANAQPGAITSGITTRENARHIDDVK